MAGIALLCRISLLWWTDVFQITLRQSTLFILVISVTAMKNSYFKDSLERIAENTNKALVKELYRSFHVPS